MANLQQNTYNNAPIRQPYIQTRPILQTKRVLDPKSGIFVHQPDLCKRIVTLNKTSWTEYRHSNHYQNSLDPFCVLLKKWTPLQLFSYLSIKLSVEPKIGHIYTVSIQAHLADVYRCRLVEDDSKNPCKARIKIMRVKSFIGQDGKTYLDVCAQYIADKQSPPQALPSPRRKSVGSDYERGYSLFEPNTQLSFIYCSKDRRKPCVINAIWNLGEPHKRLQYSLPEEHFGNFISCRNPKFQIAYEVQHGTSYNDLIQLFNHKTAPKRLDLQYTFVKHYYRRSGEYHKQQNGFCATLTIRILRLLCPKDKSEIAAIGRICQSTIRQPELDRSPNSTIVSSDFHTRSSIEDEDHLFAPSGLITIIHYGKKRASHPACIAHIVGPKTDIVGAFPVIPV